MDINNIRTVRRVAGVLVLGLLASCARDVEGAPTVDAIVEPGPTVEAAADKQGHLAELGFVPADVELLVRLDLRALAATEPGAARMLDFMLHAQQPNAWRQLDAAGLHAGTELTTFFLVVGPRSADGPSIMLAATGTIDAARMRTIIEGRGARPTPAADGATLYVLPHAQVRKRVGSAVEIKPRPGTRPIPDPIVESALGVAPGLLLLGPPDLVRRALAVRAGQGKNVREGGLVDELLALDPRAVTWAVATRAERGALSDVLPGLEHGRLTLDLAHVGQGRLELYAVFADAATAKQTVDDLGHAAATFAGQAPGSPVGKLLDQLATGSAIHVSGQVITASVTL
jgi:hypothetical protein